VFWPFRSPRTQRTNAQGPAPRLGSLGIAAEGWEARSSRTTARGRGEEGTTIAATETPNAQKISWSPPGRGNDGWRRADGTRGKTGTGRFGTYEWAVKDGLWHAYHYPHGVRTPVVLVPPQGSEHKAYRACVEHNKTGAA
jgi:hypothetical protein